MNPNGLKRNFLCLSRVHLYAAIALACSMLVVGCKNKDEAPPPEVVKPVKLMTVQSGQEELSVSLPGRVRAARRSELSFKVSGPLSELPIVEGQLIKKGDLVAQILPRDFQTAVNEARARELAAEQQYRRYKDLYAKKQVSKADFDRYRAARDVARAQLDDASNALKDTTLLAPFDGVIAKRYVENFEKVQAKEPIAFLQHTDELEILIDVPELMIARFRSDKNVNVNAEFDSIPGKSFPLTVKEFSTEADPATQTFQVVMLLKQPEEANILPGMTSKVTSISDAAGESIASSIIIPAIAVLNDADGNNYVWLFDPDAGTVKKTKVQVSQLEGTDKISITEGLTGGENVVVTGVTKLRDGQKVRPWEDQREGR